MTPYLIIDGYNLMHAAGIARQRYGRGDMERCRTRMNRELVALLSPDVLKQAVIVYDAFESVSNDNRQQVVDRLMVVYAPMGTDADSEIERLLLQHSVPKRVIVVSSDHRLHKAAARRKAACVDSEEFWTSLEAETELVTDRQAPQTLKTLPSDLPPPEKVVDELQRFAESIERAEEAADDALSSDGIFDEDYLRSLREDLDQGSFY